MLTNATAIADRIGGDVGNALDKGVAIWATIFGVGLIVGIIARFARKR